MFRRSTAATLLLCSSLLACGGQDSRSAARASLVTTPTFLQGAALEINSGTSCAVPFPAPNAAGNLVLVYVAWSNTGTASVADSRGNAYQAASAVQRWSSNRWSSQVFFARNVATGTNTVTATFGTAIASGFGIVYVHEYSGVDRASPLDGARSASGTSRAMSSGAITTTAPNDLVFGAGVSSGSVLSGGSGFTVRSTFAGNLTEDQVAAAAGSVTATATQSSNAWAMHVVALKADSTPDTTPPSTPTGLSATATSSTTVHLAWSASTDNVGVTGYDVLRDGSVVATVATTGYDDTGLAAGSTHGYAVQARDAAGNVSPPSATVPVTVTPPPPDVTPPTVSITSPTSGATLSGTVAVSASASDAVGVVGVQLLLDGAPLGAELAVAPYTLSWITSGTANGTHALSARARDAAGNLATSASVSVTVSNVPSTGLAAGYAFEEGTGTTVADASGNGNPGVLANGAGWISGRFGLAVGLDGLNARVDVGNPVALRLTGSMTVSAWIRPTSFPIDDAAIVSKRGTIGWQLDTTVDNGPRTVGFKLSSGSGADMFRYGTTILQPNAWYHVAGVYDAAAATIHVYLNGNLDDGVTVGVAAASQADSPQGVAIGQRAGLGGFGFAGAIDEVRIYARPLSQAEVQADMLRGLGGGAAGDVTPPTVAVTSPSQGAQLTGIVNVTADAADDVGVAGVQFLVDGVPVGLEDPTPPYALALDTRTVSNGAHVLAARARDAAGNNATSAGVSVSVSNVSDFQNEILATGFALPTAMKFLPDGRLLVAELQGTVRMLSPPYLAQDPGAFLALTNVGSAGVQQGIYDFALDPGFTTNRYYYVFYTLGSPNHDRLSRFTANATLDGTDLATEKVLYEDPRNANAEHHGGAIVFGNDGKLYFTTGEHFNGPDAQDLTNPRGKIHRINLDGTVPTDNPFYDGSGPNWDSVWALGLRNPYRAYYDAPTGRLIVGDVGGNDYSVAKEEVNLGARGANYGWPNSEGPCTGTCTSPIYWYPHNGRDACITGGFVYHGAQFPSGYVGAYFFADYTQNWIKYLTFDAAGKVSAVFNFEPLDGTVDGPYGDIVYLVEGPEGALYYLDLGYSDISATYGVSKVRRIKYVASNQAPVVVASATPLAGPQPLTVSFSSAGSIDPEGTPLTYAWNFGDSTTSTSPSPSHTYAAAGLYTARLTVSDGVNTSISTPISIAVGNPPVATISSPLDGAIFRAGDVISFSGDGVDPDTGVLPATAFTWNIDFLHEGHVHPGIPLTGTKSGSFTIPTTGHDFSGNTRYRIMLTVTDSTGLTGTRSVIIWPQKVNLSFATAPAGLTLELDGISKVTPFVYDTLVGFSHTVNAPDQTFGTNAYAFSSWSDGGARSHTIVVPTTDASYTATYAATTPPPPPAFVQSASATPQSPVATVGVPFARAQSAGNLNVVVVGWNDAVASITSLTDSAGNVYQLAASTFRGIGVSQAVYYAQNIRAAAANTVTVAFDRPATYVDLRVAEYSGLSLTSPLVAASSAAGTVATADSGALTTGTGTFLLVGAGTTFGGFTAAGTGYTLRTITQPDLDLLEDRVVSAAGSYSAGGTLLGPAQWVMQVAAFRGP